MATRENIATLEGHTGRVYSVVFSPDGTWLASGSRDGTVKLWDGVTRENIATLEGHTGRVYSVSYFRRMGRSWLPGQGIPRSSCGSQGMARSSCGTWRPEKISLPSKGIRIGSIRWYFRRMGRGSLPDHWITRSSCGTGRQEKISLPSKGIRLGVYSVVFSPDGTRLASGSGDGTVKLWDGATRENIATLEGHTDPGSIRWYFRRMGRGWLPGHGMAQSSCGTGRQEKISLPSKGIRIGSSVVFSPDGTRLASGSFDGTVKLWDVASREEIATLKGHTSWVESVVFSSDGTLLASASGMARFCCGMWPNGRTRGLPSRRVS